MNRGNQPTCSCPPDYLGDMCQYSKCEGFCENSGTCLQTSNGTKVCRCSSQFIGHQCELNKCLFCGTGECLTSTNGEVSCLCPNGRTQPSCYSCLDYCANGQCSVDTRTLLPQCKCPTGWQGYRCEVAAAPVDSSSTSGNTASIVIPVLLLLLLALLVVGAILWYKQRMRGSLWPGKSRSQSLR